MQAEGGRWSRRRSRTRGEVTSGARSEGAGALAPRRVPTSGPAGRAQCRVAMLQSKLRSADLRIAGQCETIKVLEAALGAKDDDLQRLEEVRTLCECMGWVRLTLGRALAERRCRCCSTVCWAGEAGPLGRRMMRACHRYRCSIDKHSTLARVWGLLDQARCQNCDRQH